MKTDPPTRAELEKQRDIIVKNVRSRSTKCDPCDAPKERKEAVETHGIIDMNRSANRAGY